VHPARPIASIDPAAPLTAPAAETLRLDRTAWMTLAALCAAAAAIRLGTAAAMPTVAHPDEIYQYLEAAHRWIFGYGVVTWEYRVGTRSWLLPGLLGLAMAPADALTRSPEGYLAAVAAMLTAISLAAVVTAFLWGLRTQGRIGALVAGGCVAGWCDLVMFAPKPLTEALAAHLLLPALYLLRFPDGRTARRLAAAGALLALVVMLRIHLAPAALVAAAWACGGDLRGRWAPLAAGGAAVVLAAGLLDAVTWSWPFQSLVLNVWVNLVEGKADMFGVSPAHWYAAIYLYVWSWAGAPMMVALLVARREALAVLVGVAILAAHSAVGHKEYRFLFPAVPVAVLLVGLGTAALARRLAGGRPAAAAALAGAALVFWSAVSLAVAQRAPFASQFDDFAWKFDAYVRLGHEPDLCGLALYRIPFHHVPGYAWLHRDVPIVVMENAEDTTRLAPFANYVMTGADQRSEFPGYATWSCGEQASHHGRPARTLCVLRRPGACAAPAENQINDFLRRRGY